MIWTMSYPAAIPQMRAWACLRIKPPFWTSDYLDAYAPLYLKEGIYRRKIILQKKESWSHIEFMFG